jgi:hypothetical protein
VLNFNFQFTKNRVAFGYEGEETVVSILSTGSGDLKSVESYFKPDQVPLPRIKNHHLDAPFSDIVICNLLGRICRSRISPRH